MKFYTFDEIYREQLGYLTDKFIEENDRQPNIGEENSMSAEARDYAKDFMDELAAWKAEAKCFLNEDSDL